MFLIENDGYTIERFVHGPEAGYNDIPQWQYRKIAEAMLPERKANSKKFKTWHISTRRELENLLNDDALQMGRAFNL